MFTLKSVAFSMLCSYSELWHDLIMQSHVTL